MPAPIEVLLPRLDGVKVNGRGKWMARCPTRADKTPSLSIRELDDGRVLLHDFGGDSAIDVLAAIGLTFADLRTDGGQLHTRRGPSPEAIQHERAVYQIGLSMRARSLSLNVEDQARFDLAQKRLGIS